MKYFKLKGEKIDIQNTQPRANDAPLALWYGMHAHDVQPFDEVRIRHWH